MMVIQTLYTIVLVLVAASDLWRLRIPNALILALAVLFAAAAVQGPVEVDWPSHLGAVLVMLAAGAVLYGIGVMGAGDAKLLAVTSLWIGLEWLPAHLAYTAVFGLIVAGCVLSVRRLVPLVASRLGRGEPATGLGPVRQREVPYGIAIAASSLVLSARVPLFLPAGTTG